MVKDPLGSKALREVKSNIKQYLSVILIAALAVTLFTGILANWRNFDSKVNKIYKEANMCDAIITTELVQNNPNDTDLIKYLNSFNKEELEYEKRLIFLGKCDNVNLNIVAFDTDNTKLNLPLRNDGKALTNNDILVDSNFLYKKNITLEDEITVSILGLGMDINLTSKISATMTHPEALDNSTYSSSLLYIGKDILIDTISNYIKETIPNNPIYANKGFIEAYLKNSYNQILLKGPKTAEVIKTVKDEEKYPTVIYALNRVDLPTNMTIEQDIIQAKQLLYIFPVIFYAVALLIILTSITQLINKEAKNIGLLRALGYSKSEIIIHYISIFMIVSLIGSIIGIILGPLIIPSVLDQKYYILYQLPKIKMPFFRFEYLYSILILFIITIINTLLALNSTLRKLPASSIRGDNNYQMKDTILDKVSSLDGKVLNIKMALRNMKRSFSRTFMVILGVMGCSALLLCGFGIEDTLNNSIDKELSLVDYDVTASYKTTTSIVDDLEKVDGVDYVAEFGTMSIEVSKDSVIKSTLYLIPTNVEMINYDIDDNSCLISTKVSDSIGAKVGDKIKYTYANKEYLVTITAILDASFSQGIFISTTSSLAHPEYRPNNVYIKAKDGVDNIKLAEEIEKVDNIMNATSIDELLVSIDNTLGSIRIMTNTVKIFAILLAIVVLYNLALLNFNDRTRDIATLKVLGYSKREIISSFVIEILVLTIFGSLFGLLLGDPLMRAVLGINENPLLTYLYHIKPTSYIFTILLTAISSVLMNIYMSKNIKKVKMVESLKSVE